MRMVTMRRSVLAVDDFSLQLAFLAGELEMDGR